MQKAQTSNNEVVADETKKTWFTKTLAKETVEAKTSEMVANGSLSAEAKAVLDNLFSGKVRAIGDSLVRNSAGQVVAKRCSYFDVFLPIGEFGTVGTNEDGTPKYSYQSKLAATKVREAKAELAKALEDANTNLEIDEDIQAWKDAKAAAVAKSEIKSAYDGEAVAYPTAEDAQEALED